MGERLYLCEDARNEECVVGMRLGEDCVVVSVWYPRNENLFSGDLGLNGNALNFAQVNSGDFRIDPETSVLRFSRGEVELVASAGKDASSYSNFYQTFQQHHAVPPAAPAPPAPVAQERTISRTAVIGVVILLLGLLFAPSPRLSALEKKIDELRITNNALHETIFEMNKSVNEMNVTTIGTNKNMTELINELKELKKTVSELKETASRMSTSFLDLSPSGTAKKGHLELTPSKISSSNYEFNNERTLLKVLHAGLYHISVRLLADKGKLLYPLLVIDDVTHSVFYASGSAYASADLDIDVRIAAGQEIRIEFQPGANTMSKGNGAHHRVQIRRIAD
jgi:hypothetical protein